MAEAKVIKEKKKVKILNKLKKADFITFFKKLSSAVIGDSRVENFVDSMEALNLGHSVEEKEWKLVTTALLKAMSQLVEEQRPNFKKSKVDLKEFNKELSVNFDDIEIGDIENFSKDPGCLNIMEEVKELFQKWLILHGFNKNVAKTITSRLRSYFIVALDEEWQKKPEYYNELIKTKTPFSQAREEDRAWKRYYRRLDKQLDETIYGAPFGLRQIHVDLRCYWLENHLSDKLSKYKTENDKVETINLNLLKDELNSWLETDIRNDYVRIISGGPGSGKSSSVKMLAQEVMESNNRRVLLIPLHLLNFENDIESAINNFIQNNEELKEISLGWLPPHGFQPTLLIFDGLDELTGNDSVGQSIAHTFAIRVNNFIAGKNANGTKVKVLITGRDIPVQESESLFLDSGKVMHLLPYTVEDEFFEKFKLKDPAKLRDMDQRDEWWTNYNSLTGKKKSNKMPAKYRKGKLNEISAQPLLNHLLVFADSTKFETNKITSMNEIYETLITYVYKRVWGEHKDKQLYNLELEEYHECLRQIATAMWHNKSRTANGKEIKSILDHDLFSKFKGQINNSGNSLARLLTTFYFRKAGREAGEHESFEFSHKSFGEYLAAIRIVIEINYIAAKMSATGRDQLNVTKALVYWLKICGAAPIDVHILEFLREEVALEYQKDPEKVNVWQRKLAEMFTDLLIHNMPLEELGSKRPDFLEELSYARNAGETLLAALNACVRVTKKSPEWTGKIKTTAFGELLRFIQGQTHLGFSFFTEVPFVNKFLRRLDLSGQCLGMAYLVEADLARANLIESSLERAYLEGADLERARLEMANIRKVSFRGARLNEAHLEGADLQKANLSHARLERTHLEAATLRGARLFHAKMQGAKMIRAQLEGVHYNVEDIKGVIFLNKEDIEGIGRIMFLDKEDIEDIEDLKELNFLD